jgi:hypothetical protein
MRRVGVPVSLFLLVICLVDPSHPVVKRFVAMSRLEVGKNFSRTPGGRYISDGPDSGQLFRDRFLVPALRESIEQNEKLTVILDGPRGYLSSFLEEAFGGLVRYGLFDKTQLKNSLEITFEDQFYQPYKLIALNSISRAKPQNITAA